MDKRDLCSVPVQAELKVEVNMNPFSVANLARWVNNPASTVRRCWLKIVSKYESTITAPLTSIDCVQQFVDIGKSTTNGSVRCILN